MPPKKLQQSPPVIAQLITDKTISYVLDVFVHKGYLAQLRSRGIGPPQPVFRLPSDQEPYKVEYAAYEDYFTPLLNELALARRGLNRAEVEAWLKMPGNDGFTHPQCVPLCLRWGQNAEGIFAQEYVAPPGNPDNEVELIPYSCKQSGLTYYCLCQDDYAFRGSRYEKELKKQGILLEHTKQLGSECHWHGWYSTDLPGLQKALSAYALVAVLVQYVVDYGVGYYEKNGAPVWGESYYLRSEAEARYAQFAEDPAYDAYQTNEYPRLKKGTSYSVRGRGVDGGLSGEKVLLKKHLAQARRGKAPVFK